MSHLLLLLLLLLLALLLLLLLLLAPLPLLLLLWQLPSLLLQMRLPLLLLLILPRRRRLDRSANDRAAHPSPGLRPARPYQARAGGQHADRGAWGDAAGPRAARRKRF